MRCAIVFLLLVLTGVVAPAQQPSSPLPDQPLGIIDTILIGGNAKTREYVILNEMTLKRGDTATVRTIEYDRNRIYSLGLFTRVDISYDSLESMHFLFIDVSERWYLIPIPMIGFRDGDPKRFFGGAGLLHNNVGGENKKLFASVVLGSDPSAGLSFSDPLFDVDHQLAISYGLSFSRVRNKSEKETARTGEFDEDHYGGSIGLGKRFSLTQTAGLSFSYQGVEVGSWWPGRTVSPNGKDHFMQVVASYQYDSRDLSEYAREGSLFAIAVRKLGLGESSLSLTRIAIDIRKYVTLPLEFTFASRAQANLVAGGVDPTYDHVYFGYSERLRGWFKTVYEGEDIAGGTVELRHYLLEPKVIRVGGLPLPEEFAVWRFGLAAILFANGGATWYRGDVLDWSTIQSGYGGGLFLMLPYGFGIRTEYAWNQYHRGEFILDLRGVF